MKNPPPVCTPGQHAKKVALTSAYRLQTSNTVCKDRLPFVEIHRPSCFDIRQILDCGQAFRFQQTAENTFEGIALGRALQILQSEDYLRIVNCTENEYNTIWRHYFALDEDYAAIQRNILSRFKGDSTIRCAMQCGNGIRILRQDPWETLCSFILSQNNNIPRIKRLISSLSAAFGTPVHIFGKTFFTFPTAQVLYEAGEKELFELKTGFRAKYLYDAAQKYLDGSLDFDYIMKSEYSEGMRLLQGVKGVGPKVASCVLLFAFNKTEAFPVDVWIKKILDQYYPDGLDIPSLGKYAGIAQQYLFYYARYQHMGKD